MALNGYRERGVPIDAHLPLDYTDKKHHDFERRQKKPEIPQLPESTVQKLKQGYTAAVIRTILADPELGHRYFKFFNDSDFLNLKDVPKDQRNFKVTRLIVSLMRDAEIRPRLIEAMILDMRARSSQRKQAIASVQQLIESGDFNNEAVQTAAVYDDAVIGAGVNSSIFDITRSNNQPNIKSLTIEASSVVSANFHLFRDFLRVNSDNAADVGGIPSLTGNNLNTFGKASVAQIPYYEPMRYPTGEVFSDQSTLDEFFSENDLIMGASVLRQEFQGEVEGSEDWPAPIRTTILDHDTNSEMTIFNHRSIVGAGMGKSKIPHLDKGNELIEYNIATAERVLARLAEASEEFGTEYDIPPPSDVMTYEQLVAYVTQVPTALRYFAGKRVGIAGPGDSGKTLIEYFMRMYSSPMYRQHVAQFGEPAALVWFGQDATNNRELLQDMYERYGPIAAGLPTPEGQHEHLPFIVPVPGHLSEIEESKDPKAKYTTLSRPHANPAQPNLPFSEDLGIGNRDSSVDFLITTVGYDNRVGEMFGKKEDEKTGVVDNPFLDPAESEDIMSYFKDITQPVVVSRKLKGRPVYCMGPIMGMMPKLEGLKSNRRDLAPTVQAMGPRAERLAEMLATPEAVHGLPQIKESLRQEIPLALVRGRGISLQLPVEHANDKLPYPDKLAIRVTLARIFEDFKLQAGNKNVTLQLQLIPEAGKGFRIAVAAFSESSPEDFTLDEDSTYKLVKAFHGHKVLNRQLMALAASPKRARYGLSITVPFTSKGNAEIHKLTLNESRI